MTSSIGSDYLRSLQSLSGSSVGAARGSSDNDGDDDFAAMLKKLNDGTSSTDTMASAMAGGAATQQLGVGAGMVPTLAQDNNDTQDAMTSDLDFGSGSSSSSSSMSYGTANGRWLASLFGGSNVAAG
jgi:hypothetical protein